MLQGYISHLKQIRYDDNPHHEIKEDVLMKDEASGTDQPRPFEVAENPEEEKTEAVNLTCLGNIREFHASHFRPLKEKDGH